MGQNKEELKKLLSFIEALVQQPGNEEFVAGLRSLVGAEQIQQYSDEQLSSYLRLQRERFKR